MILAAQMVCVDPRTDALWATLIQQQASSLFNTPSWMQVLADTYGYEPRALVMVDSSGTPTAGMAFCQISDPLGVRIVSLPFSDYCDPLVNTLEDWHLLVNQLEHDQYPIALRCLHTHIPCGDTQFVHIKQARWHGMDISRDTDTIWRDLPSLARWSINRARRDAVTVQIDTSEEGLRAFYELHSRVRKYKYGMLAQPYTFFQNIWKHFVARGKGVLLTAMYQDRLIAGMLFLEWKDTLYYKFNASEPAYLTHQPNDLLMWEAVQYAKEQGMRMMDFGLSDWDQEGLIRYKQKYATEEGVITFLRSSSASSDSQHERQLRGLMGQLTALFVDPSVPDNTTEQAGALLYRFFA